MRCVYRVYRANWQVSVQEALAYVSGNKFKETVIKSLKNQGEWLVHTFREFMRWQFIFTLEVSLYLFSMFQIYGNFLQMGALIL